MNLDHSLEMAAELVVDLAEKKEKKQVGTAKKENAIIKIIGVYRIKPSKKSIEKAALYHGHEYLLDKKGNYTEKINRRNFRNLGLIELEVEGTFFINKVQLNTEGTAQTPYLEFYLNEQGTDVLFDPSRDSKIFSTLKTQADAFNQILNNEKKRRICFFIHFVHPSTPLLIDDQFVTLPEFTEIPERLKDFINYLPVD